MQITLKKSMLKKMEVIGQLDDKYILTFVREENVILVIDQHAAHERIRLETMLKDIHTNYSKSSLIKICKVEESVSLAEDEMTMLLEHRNAMNRWGFKFRVGANRIGLSGKTVILESVPSIYSIPLSAVDFKDFLHALCRNRFSKIHPPAFRRILISRACRGAVMFSSRLSFEKMRQIAQNLGTCDAPFICAHGRPSMIPLLQLP